MSFCRDFHVLKQKRGYSGLLYTIWKNMRRESLKQDNLKIIFSLISLFLMIPSLINGDIEYYKTLFIFLINKVIDITFEEKNREMIFFIIWSIINQWVGAIVCAIAFCSILPEFRNICLPYSKIINLCLFVGVLSCILKDMIKLIILSVITRIQ